MDWEGIFGNMSPASFFNFSFLGEYGKYILQALGYTLLLAVVSVLLAVIPALLLAIMRDDNSTAASLLHYHGIDFNLLRRNLEPLVKGTYIQEDQLLSDASSRDEWRNTEPFTWGIHVFTFIE